MAENIRTYRDLLAWQRGIDLVAAVYRTSGKWPKDEMFGLTSQARRAAVSVATNVAEGHGRSNADFRRFLVMALGSLKELETCVLIAERLEFGVDKDRVEVMDLAHQVGRLANGLVAATRRNDV